MDTNIPIFVVRHGERADDAGIEESNKIVLEFDPHLTDFGKVQALFAGK
jgi:broad specificity phosphatase PhoE